MKRQPTTWGSSPWQHVDKPLGWRGVAPVWPTWFRWVMKPQHRLTLSRLIDQRLAAAERCARGAKEAENQRFPPAQHAVFPSACFLVQPAPATNSKLASGRMVCASLFGARTPVTTVLVAAGGRVTGICSTLAAPRAAVQCYRCLVTPGRFAAGLKQHNPRPRVAANDCLRSAGDSASAWRALRRLRLRAR